MVSQRLGVFLGVVALIVASMAQDKEVHTFHDKDSEIDCGMDEPSVEERQQVEIMIDIAIRHAFRIVYLIGNLNVTAQSEGDYCSCSNQFIRTFDIVLITIMLCLRLSRFNRSDEYCFLISSHL